MPAIQKLKDVNIIKVIDIALRLYEKYSKVNIEKLYVKLNEKLKMHSEQ